MPQNNDVNVYNLVMPYIVAPSRLELDDNIVTFCSNINNKPVVICYRVYITLYKSLLYMWIHLDTLIYLAKSWSII